MTFLPVQDLSVAGKMKGNEASGTRSGLIMGS